MEKRTIITGIGFLNDWVVGKGSSTRFLSGAAQQTPLDKIDFDAYIDTSLVRRADHVSRCAVVAAKLALEDADLSMLSSDDKKTVGVVLGTVHGPLHYSLEYHTSLVRGDPKLSSPLYFSESVPNAAVSHISTVLGIRGYTTTISGYCAVMQALRLGAELIEEEIVDLCLVGGADINPDFLVNAYDTCLNNSELVAKSFGGSGFLVLESPKHAMKRNAKAYAQIEGVSTVTASYDVAKRHNVSPLRELLHQTGDIRENDGLLKSSYDEKDSRQREDMYLQDFKYPRNIFDCSNKFGYGFSAAESFQLILGILGVYAPEHLSSLEACGDLKKQLDRMFVMHTALAGANSCALFSRYSTSRG